MKNMYSIIGFLIICLFVLQNCKKEYSCENCTDGNMPPFAFAGNDSTIVFPVDSTSLNGSSSFDPDGNIRSWAWRMIKGPNTASIFSPKNEKTLVKFSDTGSFVFELKVTDNKGWPSRDSIQIIVVRPPGSNRPPIANAGPDQKILLPGSQAVLDGRASSDPENNIVSYQWLKILGPPAFSITDDNKSVAQAASLVRGLYWFELTVVDGEGLKSKDTAQIEIASPLDAENCNGESRPVVNARLTPIGKLSKPRIMMTTAAVGKKIIFAGGRLTPDCPECFGSYRVDIYDTESGQWSTAQLSEGRFGMASVTMGNKVFFAGGEIGDGYDNAMSNMVDVYDASTNSWTTLTLSEPRSFIGAAGLGNKIFFAGGWRGNTQSGQPSSKIDIYDVGTNKWITPKSLFEPRGWISAVSTGQNIYFAGGMKSFPAERTVMIDVYNGLTDKWSTSSLNSPMSHMAGLFEGGNIYWAYGCNVQILNVNRGNSLAAKLHSTGYWINGGGQNAVVKDNKIIFFRQNGETFGIHSNGFDIYDMSTGTWSIGLLPNFNLAFTSIISLNNKIYLAGGAEVGSVDKASDQVWLLDF